MPPVCRARDGSARQNRLNTSRSSPGFRPTPWSRTVTATAASSVARVTSTGRPSPCSTALPTRLRSTRSTRRGSTSAITGVSGSRSSIATPTRSARPASRSTTRSTIGTEVGVLGVQRGEPGVEPADLQQVGQQALEPVQLGLQQLGAAGHRRVELVALGEDQVGRHPDRGERGAQLVRHVRGEPALQPGHLLEADDLPLQVRRHLVERGRQQRQVVLAVDLHPLVEQAGREPLGGPGGHPDRADHHPGDQRRHHAEQDHQRQRRWPARWCGSGWPRCPRWSAARGSTARRGRSWSAPATRTPGIWSGRRRPRRCGSAGRSVRLLRDRLDQLAR